MLRLKHNKTLLIFLILIGAIVTIMATLGVKAKSVIQKWADAIQNHEGWYNGSRSFRNNNPGNLRVQGDEGVDKDGFGKFSSYELGRSALEKDLAAKLVKYPTYTILQIMERYAPSSDGNNTQAYAQVVATALGVDVNTKLASLVV